MTLRKTVRSFIVFYVAVSTVLFFRRPAKEEKRSYECTRENENGTET